MRKGDAGFISVRFPVTASNIENTPSAVWSGLLSTRRKLCRNHRSLDRQTLSRSLLLHVFYSSLERLEHLNTPFIYFICKTLEDYHESWFLVWDMSVRFFLDLYTVTKTAINIMFDYPYTRLCLKLIYRAYMSYICDPEILVTRFPREPEDIFGRAIYNYACQFSVIRSLLHVFALVREILGGVLISEFLGISRVFPL